VERPGAPEVPFGAHHPDGTLLTTGPSFREATGGTEHSIYDVAPTLLHLLGVPVPEHFDGRVMTDLLNDDAAKDVRRQTVKSTHAETARTASPGDDEIVRRRLRSLGYLE
jgi:arylsulfatase A-like enzyme